MSSASVTQLTWTATAGQTTASSVAPVKTVSYQAVTLQSWMAGPTITVAGIDLSDKLWGKFDRFQASIVYPWH